MTEKKEARRSLAAGRATYRGRYTGSIPRGEFERGCKLLCAMFVAVMAFVTALEVIGL